MKGIFPSFTKKKEISAFKKTYGAKFPLDLDKDGQIITGFGATVTPEVFLTDSHKKLIYSGAIDNWYFDLGRNRKEVTEHYLLDAINAALKGETPPVANTKAIGCVLQSHPMSDMEHMTHQHN